MQKILKLSTVSILAIMAANGANAAGYTCEELIEYTSCNAGYYLNAGDCIEGTTCGAGNYLKATCPDGYYFFTSGCLAEGSVDTGHTAETCAADFGDNGVYYDTGNWCEGYNSDIDDVEVVVATISCTPCSVGTYQSTAGQYSCTTCPAGSYCATSGLATVSGTCAKGQYSMPGATACSSCPTHTYTDAGGQSVNVPATTVSTGSGSLTACIIDSNTYFTDTAGTYHFKSNCAFAPTPETFAVNSEQDCLAVDGSWVTEYEEPYCSAPISIIPETEQECNAVGLDWVLPDERCGCEYPDADSGWVGNKLQCVDH